MNNLKKKRNLKTLKNIGLTLLYLTFALVPGIFAYDNGMETLAIVWGVIFIGVPLLGIVVLVILKSFEP